MTTDSPLITRPARVLVVEDEGIVAQDIRQTLEGLGYEVIGQAPSAEQALKIVDKLVPDLVLMDIRIQGELSGIQLAKMLKARHRLAVVFLTAHTDDATLADAKASDPVGYIRKPFTSDDLKVAVEIALRTQGILTTLSKSNDSLNSLVRSVAHDLREPLRAVRCYSTLLAHAVEDSADSEREFLQYITEGCSRMDTMLSSLLDYYCASEAHGIASPVDASEVLQRALANLASLRQTTGALINVSALPTVQIHPTALLQVFQNLISNAIKFASEERRPIISVNATRDGALGKFTVADNGIGFPPNQSGRIFSLFARAHGQKRSGSGIGLATCRTLVEEYGGTIWAESSVGNGSQFHFTLPLASTNVAEFPLISNNQPVTVSRPN